MMIIMNVEATEAQVESVVTRIKANGFKPLVLNGEERKVIDEYDVDLGHCLFCGLCAEVCPEEAIVLSCRYEASYYQRAATVLHKSDLLRHGEGL